MLGSVTRETFTPHIGEYFHVQFENEDTVELQLDTVDPSKETSRHYSFALYFTGPGDRALRQGLYDMRHETLGDVMMFVVPVEVRESKVVYEAVFNLMKDT